MISEEAVTGTILGSMIGTPGLGPALGGINTASKALVTATEDVPVLGEVVQAGDAVMTAAKTIFPPLDWIF